MLKILLTAFSQPMNVLNVVYKYKEKEVVNTWHAKHANINFVGIVKMTGMVIEHTIVDYNN